jgi:amino acid adenylation domain-containing protein
MTYLLHQLLERTAAHHPDRPAVMFKGESLTYRELHETSSQLAHLLRRYGVEAGDRVGIYVHRSLESVVAVFGILKAGAVYVPIDPSVPVNRAAFIIENCEIKALIGAPKTLIKLGQALARKPPIRCVVFTDTSAALIDGYLAQVAAVSWPEVANVPVSQPPPSQLIEDDLAYILYTSGSTGAPKGVMISHRAALTFVNWACKCFHLQPTDRVANHAPLHFDLSIFDIFATIKAGATVILVPDELSAFPLDLANFIEEQRISVWYSVPSVLTRLVLYGGLARHRFSQLRHILFAGEVFPIKYLRQLKALIPHAQHYNLYGPTETNVCTYYAVQEIAPERIDPFPIGRACANIEVFAVTEHHEIAQPGEVGELHVRGPSLMKGYWGMPDKTQEVLIPDPRHTALRGEQVYRTGDLVKQEPDGNYVFLGRRDNMIKSRGYRIELGEIESVLYRHPEVEEAAVLAIPDEQMGNLIKAVVVVRGVDALTSRQLEAFCAEHLPKYMIPGSIEVRAYLPKTSTGKIDKTQLLNVHLETRSA